jgi:YceI-like protein
MRFRIAVALLGAWLVVAPASADTRAKGMPIDVTLGAGSALWLEGTSNVHDFVCRTAEVEATLTGDSSAAPTVGAASLYALIGASGVRGMAVRVPVKSLRSEKEGLDKNLQKAMKADQFPDVQFALGPYALTAGAAATDSVAIRCEGRLTICGAERPVTLDARVRRDGAGVWLTGSYTLKMSEYGIKPPTMMMGTMRVHDPITVNYRLFLIPSGEAAGSPSHPEK